MFAVPPRNAKNHVTSGATKTMRFGCARMIFSAIRTM